MVQDLASYETRHPTGSPRQVSSWAQHFPGHSTPTPSPVWFCLSRAASPLPCSELEDTVWTLPAAHLLSRACLRSKPVGCGSLHGSVEATLILTVLTRLGFLFSWFSQRPSHGATKTASLWHLLSSAQGQIQARRELCLVYPPISEQTSEYSWTFLMLMLQGQWLGNEKSTWGISQHQIQHTLPCPQHGAPSAKGAVPVLLASQCNLCHTPAGWSQISWTESGSSHHPAALAWYRWKVWPEWCSDSYLPETAGAHSYHLVPVMYTEEESCQSHHGGSHDLSKTRTWFPQLSFSRLKPRGK